MKILVFGGTTEGRELSAALAGRGHQVTVCVATEYGEEVLPQTPGIFVRVGRMDAAQMGRLIQEQGFDCVADATHPYAQVVSQEARTAAQAQGVPYYRLCRESLALEEGCAELPSVQAAAQWLADTEGNILLTTGSKELLGFSSIPDFAKRCWARVLPSEESIQLCRQAGLPMSHIIAMQGPFSRELNTAMLRQIQGAYLVTKESGKAGGFGEKLAAAREAGAKIVVIRRPEDKSCEGYSMEELLCRLKAGENGF